MRRELFEHCWDLRQGKYELAICRTTDDDYDRCCRFNAGLWEFAEKTEEDFLSAARAAIEEAPAVAKPVTIAEYFQKVKQD